MNNFSLRYKILIIISIIIITLLSVGYFIILPSRSAIIRAKDIIETRRQEMEKKYTRGQDISLLTKNMEKINNQAKNLNQIFVVYGQELNFITALEKTAEKNHITQIIHMSPPKENKEANKKTETIYQTTGLQLSVSGKFSDIIKYLNDLEKLNYYLNINSININNGNNQNSWQRRQNTANNEQKVSATIQATIYFISEDNLI